MAMQAFLGQVPQLDVRRLEGGLEDAKASLVTDPNRLAVAIVEPNAIDDTEGSYELFVHEKLDDRVEDELHKALREAIVDARIRARGGVATAPILRLLARRSRSRDAPSRFSA